MIAPQRSSASLHRLSAIRPGSWVSWSRSRPGLTDTAFSSTLRNSGWKMTIRPSTATWLTFW